MELGIIVCVLGVILVISFKRRSYHLQLFVEILTDEMISLGFVSNNLESKEC